MYDVVKSKISKGRIASDDDVHDVCRAIDGVSLEDLGLDPALAQVMTYNTAAPNLRALRSRTRLAAAPSGREPITYLHIHEDPSMTIGIFCLPAGARIPLHNHPGMTVFSRLLYGTLHIRAYDWKDSGGGTWGGWGGSCVRAARLVTDRVLTAPAPTSVLFPSTGGNIHAFTAVSPCAILDVLAPPYAPKDGRDCTYFRELLPAALLDVTGQPLLPTAEAVAAEALAGALGAGSRPDPHAVAARRMAAAARAGGLAAAAAAAGHEIVVGLEEWDAPDDFTVVRGAYHGLNVLR